MSDEHIHNEKCEHVVPELEYDPKDVAFTGAVNDDVLVDDSAIYAEFIKDVPDDVINKVTQMYNLVEAHNTARDPEWKTNERMQWFGTIQMCLYQLLGYLGYNAWTTFKESFNAANTPAIVKDVIIELLYNNMSSEILTMEELVGTNNPWEILTSLGAASMHRGFSVPLDELAEIPVCVILVTTLNSSMETGRAAPQQIGDLCTKLGISFEDVYSDFIRAYTV